jgi:hypothetical protein
MDKYGGQGGTGYFSLKNDRDVATVRFLYNTADDVEGYAVHEVEIDGKKRYVNCLREYNQPIDDCPFCKARKYQVAKLFIPMYNVDEEKVQVWERGKKFFNKLSSVLARCDADPIYSQTFDIERNGKAGDTQTTYEIYQTKDKPDDFTLDDCEEPMIFGRIVLDKSAEDMEFYLEEGYFPPEDEEPVRRRSSRREEREEEDERPRRRSSRRTPSDTF